MCETCSMSMRSSANTHAPALCTLCYRDPERTSVVERLGDALRDCCELDVVVEEEALLQREMVPRAWAQRVRATMSRYPTLEALEVWCAAFSSPAVRSHSC